MTKYFDRDGNPVPRHLAVDAATGQVLDGITVHVPQRMCDTATVIVRDTPLTDGEQAEARAFQAYVQRMTGKPRDDADKAPPATANDEHSAYAKYVTRFNRKKA